MAFKDNVKKGTTELLVLSLLSQQDMYGYQICQTLAEKSNQVYTISEGSLYPILYRLSQAGYISERVELVKRRSRVYYHLEESGQIYFKQCMKEYRILISSIFDILGETYERDKNEQN